VNPALPGGADGAVETPDTDGWLVSSRLAYTYVPYGELQQGTAEAPNPSDLAIAVHLGSLQATAVAPTGTSLDVQLPFGALRTTSLVGARTDRGLGDLELRVRQSSSRWLRRPRLGATAGLVLPTGEYVARSGAANLPPEAVTLALGRGTLWLLGEADVQVGIGPQGSVFAQLSARAPVGRTSDDFSWGAELRASVGGSFVASRRWSILGTVDLQWRGEATEPDPFSGMRLESANAGGVWFTASPAVRFAVTSELAITAGARLALAADVTGNQLVPQAGGFVALSLSRAVTSPRVARRLDEPVARAATGRMVVVDYWATWCKPCAQIDADLRAAQARWGDVQIERIDATEWPDPAAPALPVGASGLPVVEIYDASGQRTHLLVGTDATRVVEIVDSIRSSAKGTTP
jgi:thiol-disulfide isomerase/thioredoxin